MKAWCEFLGGLGQDQVTTAWLRMQQVFWLYLFALGLHAAWHWSDHWKTLAHHGQMSVYIGAFKTVGFAVVDLLALLGLQAARHAYSSEQLQAFANNFPHQAEHLAWKLTTLGAVLCTFQFAYWSLFLYSMVLKVIEEDDPQVSIDRVICTGLGAAGLVASTPGLVCAFFPVLLGLSSAEERLEELQSYLDPKAEQICWGTFLREYGAAEQHVAIVSKELYSSITWLLGASLLYTLTQCFSVWVWIDKVALAPISVYVTYALAVLYGSAFATGYGLFSNIEQHHAQIVGAVAKRLPYCQQPEEALHLAQVYHFVSARPLKWKVPLSPKWPMAPTLERLQAAMLVASSSGALGLQLLQGLLKVKELADDKLGKRIQELSPEVMLCNRVKGKGCTPADPADEMRKRFFEEGSRLRRAIDRAFRRLLPHAAPKVPEMKAPKAPEMKKLSLPRGPSPRRDVEEMQLVLHSSPAAFAVADHSLLLVPLLLGLLFGLSEVRSRRRL